MKREKGSTASNHLRQHINNYTFQHPVILFHRKSRTRPSSLYTAWTTANVLIGEKFLLFYDLLQ